MFRLTSRLVIAGALAGTAVIPALSSVTAAGASSSPTSVKFAYDFPFPDMELIPAVVAQKEGFFKKQNLKVSVVFPPSTSTTVQMLSLGSAHIGMLTTSDVPVAVAAGAPIVSIANYSMTNNWGLFAKPGSGLSLKDLKGKRVFSWGDTWTSAMLPFVVKKAGLTMNDIKVVTGDSDTPLLLANKVDFLTNTTNYAIPGIIDATGKKPVQIAGAKAGVPKVPVWVYATSKTYAKKNKDTVIRFMRAMHDATLWATTHRAEAVRDFDKAYPKSGYSHAYNVRAWNLTVPLLTTSKGDLFIQSSAEWRTMANALKGIGQLKKVLNPTSYYTNAYVR